MFEGVALLNITALVVIILTQTTDAVPGLRFTSVLDMEALAQQENHLLDSLRHYINTQQAKLSLLNVRLEELTKARPPFQTAEKLISDPINAYSLVRRLTREWPLILNFMKENIDLEDELSRLPEEDCMQSAIRALTRIQEVYWLDTTDLAQDSRDSVHLTGSKNIITPGGNKNVLHQLMSQYPHYTLDEEAAQLFRQTLSPRLEKLNETQDYQSAEEERMYSRTCLGIGVHPSSDLRCYYIHYNNPRLVIGPFKMEEQNLDPPILMFHDVIWDVEINEMKAAFREVRTSCGTVMFNTDEKIVDYTRTCDVGWVTDNDTASAERISQRIGDMTNLAMATSEEHQVANYGLGGEFQLHYDPITSSDLSYGKEGARIATLMIYLNDVESGGCTAFPRVNVTVEPAKGSAVFWFNLDHKSEVLTDTLHGGCPILRGSKWVLNKWIHEGGQTSEIFCPADEIFPKKRYYLNGVN